MLEVDMEGVTKLPSAITITSTKHCINTDPAIHDDALLKSKFSKEKDIRH